MDAVAATAYLAMVVIYSFRLFITLVKRNKCCKAEFFDNSFRTNPFTGKPN